VNNEEESSRAVVEKVRSVDALGLQVETLVVDDRSTDATRAVLESLRRVPAVFRARNLGKGAGIQSAIRPATGGVFVIRDSSAAPPPAASAGGESPKLRRVCTRPAEHVVTEIVHLHRTCGVMGFMLNDDDPNANPKLPEVMRLIRRASGL
jgi:glycosyltransferase involved in cell wall biosynthesis